MDTHFKIQNRDEAGQFDKFLREYYEANCHFGFQPYLDLAEWFDWCQNDNINGGRIFASIFDIKLNYIFTDFEKIGLTQTWEQRNNHTDILKNLEDFKLSVNLLKHLSSYVLKYRALLDKLMGLIFLCYSPNDYEKYRKGKSRKTIFKKIFTTNRIPLDLDPDKIFTYLDQFDTKYRTPEAHATGSIRKWIFSDINTGFSDYYNLSLNSWNGLVFIVSEIDKIKDNKNNCG